MGNKPQPLSEVGKKFLASLGEGFLIGMTLRIYKAKIKELVGTKDFAQYITGEQIKDKTLIIYCKHPWKHELQARRYQIKQKINERLEREYLNKVKIR